MIKKWLHREFGLTSKDLRIYIGKRHYIKAFTPLWYLVGLAEIIVLGAGFWAFCTIMILLFG